MMTSASIGGKIKECALEKRHYMKTVASLRAEMSGMSPSFESVSGAEIKSSTFLLNSI